MIVQLNNLRHWRRVQLIALQCVSNAFDQRIYALSQLLVDKGAMTLQYGAQIAPLLAGISAGGARESSLAAAGAANAGNVLEGKLGELREIE